MRRVSGVPYGLSDPITSSFRPRYRTEPSTSMRYANDGVNYLGHRREPPQDHHDVSVLRYLVKDSPVCHCNWSSPGGHPVFDDCFVEATFIPNLEAIRGNRYRTYAPSGHTRSSVCAGYRWTHQSPCGAGRTATLYGLSSGRKIERTRSAWCLCSVSPQVEDRESFTSTATSLEPTITRSRSRCQTIDCV